MTTPEKESAFDMAKRQLDQWGLGTLAPTVIRLIEEGNDEASLWLKLRETNEFKTRFAGNEILKQKAAAGVPGVRVLDEAEYLNKEEWLKAQLSYYGLPPAFYDSPDDYAKIIGANLGADELGTRLEAIKTVVTSGELTGVAEYAKAKYGLGTGELMAFYLDPDKAAPIIERQAQAAAIGAAAKRTGYGDLDAATAERYQALGLNADQAAAGFAEAASLQELEREVGGDAGVARETVRRAIFEQDATAAQEVESAKNRRLSRFQGGGGFSEGRTGIAGLGSANT